jgi:hypothetical protein
MSLEKGAKIGKAYPEIINPVPPITCGAQNTPSTRPGLSWFSTLGREVKPAIQKTVALRNWIKEARKPISWK